MVTKLIFTLLNSGIENSLGLFKQLRTSASETFAFLGNQSPKDVAKLLLGLKQVSVQVREFSETDLNGIIDGYNKLKNSITAKDSEEFFKSVSLGEKWLEDYLKSLRGAEATIDGVSEAFQNAKKSQNDLSSGSKVAVAGLNALKAATSMVVAALAAWAVSKAIEWIDDWIHANERAVEAAQKLKSEYEDVKNELKNLEDELKSIAERIDELNGKPNLTLTEQSELQRLQDTNQELQTQLKIRKKLAEYQGQKAEEATVEALETKSKLSDTQIRVDITGDRHAKSIDRFEYINEQISIANTLQQRYINLSEKMANVEVGSKSWDDFDKKLQAVRKDLDGVGENINSTLVEIYDLSDGLVEGSPAWEKFTKLINIAQNAVSNFNKEDLTNRFNKVFNADEFTSAREEIEKFIQSGNEFNSEVFTQQWKSLSEELAKTGVSAEDAVQHLLATYTVLEDTTEKTYKLSEVQQGLNDSFSGFNQSVSDFQNWMNGVSDSEDNATTAAKNLNDILNQQKNILAESSEALKVYSEGIQSDIDAMELLNGVVSKLSDGQALAGKELLVFMDKVKALPEAFDPITGNTINLYDNLANYIKRTGDATFDNGKVIQANLIAYETAAEAKIEAEKQVAQTQYDMEIQTLESIKRIVEGARTAIESLPLVGGAISEALGSSFDNFLSGIDTQISDATEKFKNFNNNSYVTKAAIEGLSSATNNLKKDLQSLNSLLDTNAKKLLNARKELISNGKLSVESLEFILEKYPELFQYIDDTERLQEELKKKEHAIYEERAVNFSNMLSLEQTDANNFNSEYLTNIEQLYDDVKTNALDKNVHNFKDMNAQLLTEAQIASEKMQGIYGNISDYFNGEVPFSPDAGKGNFIRPTDTSTISFGYNAGPSPTGVGYDNHTGVDYKAASGSLIYASKAGTVVEAGYLNLYGLTVVIEHSGATYSLYAHCSKIFVSVGEKVAQGQIIALSGDTGNVTGPHLHFEIRQGGYNWQNSKAVNPSQFLSSGTSGSGGGTTTPQSIKLTEEQIAASNDAIATEEDKARQDRERKREEEFQKLYKDLQFLRDDDEASQAEYYKKLEEYNNQYHTKGSDSWRQYYLEIKQGQDKLFQEQLDYLKFLLDDGQITYAEYLNKLETLNNQYHTKGSDAWNKYYLEIKNGRDNLFKELFEKELADLEYRYARGLISTEQYLRDLYALNEKYNKDNLELWRKYDVQLYNERKKLVEKYLKDALDIAKKDKDASDKSYDAKIKREKEYLKSEKDSYDARVKALKEQLSLENEVYDSKIKALQDQLSALNKQYDEEDRLFKIEKARLELAKAQSQKTSLIYRDGKFEYEVDDSAVSEAQQNLTDLLEDWEQYKNKLALEEQVQALKDAKDANANTLNQAIKDLENARDASAAIIEENIANLESMKERAAENINSQVEKLQELSDKWSDSLDISEDSEFYKSLLDVILGDEQSSYASRLKELQSFVDEWNKQISKMKEPKTTSKVNATTTDSSGNKYSSAWSIDSFSSGGKVDYTGLAMVHGSKTEPELMLNQTGIKNVGSALGITGSTKSVAQQLNTANSGQLDTIKLLSDFVNSSNPINALNLDFSPTATTAKINSISSQLGMRNVPNLSGYERVVNNAGTTNTITIGDVHVHEVKDSNSLSKAIIKQLPNAMLQKMYER